MEKKSSKQPKYRVGVTRTVTVFASFPSLTVANRARNLGIHAFGRGVQCSVPGVAATDEPRGSLTPRMQLLLGKSQPLGREIGVGRVTSISLFLHVRLVLCSGRTGNRSD